MNMQNSYLTSKPHYEILDGLRGVAAAMVVAFHLLEAHSGGNHLNQIINHGYLAVDFFFMLSGFVIGYAYDDRWNRMSTGTFFKRRLIRLQPMVVMGSIVGAALFWFQDAPCYPAMEGVSAGAVLLVMLLGCTLLPLPLKWDVRGRMEMHPLNGPAWSLFFEYIANILYAVLIRKFTSRWLAVLVFLAACALIHQCYTQGNNIGGWTLDVEQCRVGLTRLMFPFFGGLLLFRLCKPGRVRHGFWWCSLLLVGALAMPHVGGAENFRLNGLYDAFCIIVIFPAVVFLGASDIPGDISSRASRFLGNISYPLYITHYPIVYLYLAWVHDAEVPFSRALPVAVGVLFICIAVAYGCLKLYDEPVRAWLSKRVLARRAPEQPRP